MNIQYTFFRLALLVATFSSCNTSNEPVKEERWTVTNFAGSEAGFEDGPIATAKFNQPYNLALAANGDIYVTDRGNRRIRRISNGIVTTVAGTGADGVGDGPVATTPVAAPHGIAIAANGTIYFTDWIKVKKIENGQIITVAGGTTLKDGKGTEAGFSTPRGIALGKDNAIYIADTYSHSIRRMDFEGNVTTFAGAPPSTDFGSGLIDGNGQQARFWQPQSIRQSPDGNFYVTDSQNNRIRKISSSGNVTTIPDNIEGCTGITADVAGHVYTLSGQHGRLYEVVNNVLNPLYGGTNGKPPFLFGPLDLVVTADGSILICDTNNNRIARAFKE
jgi:streptogramin lyase